MIERIALKIWARRNPPDALISNGESVRDMFSPLVPAPSFVVRNGVDTDLFRPFSRPRDGGLVVGFAGRLSPQKRPQDFLRMAARIAERRRDIRFLVAGDGRRRAVYEAIAARRIARRRSRKRRPSDGRSRHGKDAGDDGDAGADGRQSLVEVVKGFTGALEFIKPQRKRASSSLVVAGERPGRCSVSPAQQ